VAKLWLRLKQAITVAGVRDCKKFGSADGNKSLGQGEAVKFGSCLLWPRMLSVRGNGYNGQGSRRGSKIRLLLTLAKNALCAW